MLSKFNIFRRALRRAEEAENEARKQRALAADLRVELLSAQDRLRELFEENIRLREASLTDRAEALKCRELVSDWLAAQAGLRPIFGHPFEEKKAPQSDPIMPRRVLARDQVDELEREFFEAERRMQAAALGQDA